MYFLIKHLTTEEVIRCRNEYNLPLSSRIDNLHVQVSLNFAYIVALS